MSSSTPRHRALIAALAAIGVSALAAGTASAATVSANIVYTTHADKRACDAVVQPGEAALPPCHIVVQNTDGAGAQITSGSANDVDPAWSPDGKKIAFARNGGNGFDIFTMNANGSGLQQLTTANGRDDRYPTWSADGTRLAYSGYAGATGGKQILTIPSGGGPITSVPGSASGDQPAFNPDGTRIAYTAPELAAGAVTPNDEIFVSDLNGANRRNVTNRADTSDRYPAWYPSGSRIAFRRFTPPPAAPSPRQLFTIDCADTGCRERRPGHHRPLAAARRRPGGVLVARRQVPDVRPVPGQRWGRDLHRLARRDDAAPDPDHEQRRQRRRAALGQRPRDELAGPGLQRRVDADEQDRHSSPPSRRAASSPSVAASSTATGRSG